MAYKVFISHSTPSQKLIYYLAQLLNEKGIEVFIAEWRLSPGVDLRTKVFPQIDASDCVIALLTKEGVRSEWVNQELGYAYKAQKMIIPIVEEGVQIKGILETKEYIPFNRYNPESIYRAMNIIGDYIHKLKLQKEKQDQVLLIGGLALLALLVLGGGKGNG